MSKGIKFVRKGYDARKASNENLVFSSDFVTFKICKIIKFAYDVTRNELNPSNSLHGLTYPPAYVPFSEDPNNPGYFQNSVKGYFEGAGPVVWVDNTKVYYNQPDETYIFIFTDSLNE